MVAAGLSPRTVNKYIEYVRLVVASLVDNNPGEPIFERKWNRKEMGLPKVRKKDQRRPSLTTEIVNALICKADSEKERVLYVLLAATGLRISEALALETKHFTNSGRTIVVEQQVERDEPVIRIELKRMLEIVRLTCIRTLQSTCNRIPPEKAACCLPPATAHHICTTISKSVGSRRS